MARRKALRVSDRVRTVNVEPPFAGRIIAIYPATRDMRRRALVLSSLHGHKRLVAIDHLEYVEEEVPEAVSVKVVTPSEETARLAAPMLARRLYPGRRFGGVLNTEWLGNGFAVDVEVRR